MFKANETIRKALSVILTIAIVAPLIGTTGLKTAYAEEANGSIPRTRGGDSHYPHYNP